MKRLVIPLLAAFVIALFVLLKQPQNPTTVIPGSTRSNHTAVPGSESPNPSPHYSSPARTKSRIRAIHHKPTIEETTELLKNTIIPVVDLPEQSLPDQVAAINQTIQKAGVAPYELRLIHNKSDPSAKWKKGELRARNVPIAVVLKLLCGRTKLISKVRENGIVEITTMTDDPIIHPGSNETHNENDPFSDPPSTTVSKPAGSAGEVDPFGPAGEVDPFAEP